MPIHKVITLKEIIEWLFDILHVQHEGLGYLIDQIWFFYLSKCISKCRRD